jgi:hypothetical protein
MPRRITRGDAEAVLNAAGTGGRVILRNGQTTEAAPADFLGSHGSIRPFSGSPWDGRHFCAEDWHVILIAWIDGGDASFGRQQAQANLDPVTNTFTLDGATLAMTRTPIKPALNPQGFGLERAWYFQEGRVMSPEDLSVGQHQLSVRFTDGAGRGRQRRDHLLHRRGRHRRLPERLELTRVNGLAGLARHAGKAAAPIWATVVPAPRLR